MAAYNITTSSGGSIQIQDGLINNNYSVPIVGQNTPAFGDDIATAFIRGLENFAADLAPDQNTNIPGTSLLVGQLWYDTLNVQLKVWTGSIWAPLLTSSAGASFQGDVVPSTDSTYDIGTTGLRWAEGWFDNFAFGGTMTAEAASTLSVQGTLTAAGGSTVNLNGTNNIAGATFTDKAVFDAASGTQASVNIPVGTSTTTTDGDIWFDGSNLRIVVGSVQKTIPLSDGISVGVATFNGRDGTVTPEAGDYASFYPRKDSSAGSQTIDAAATWTFANRPAFNGGADGVSAPFTVDSNFLVSKLNAQYLNGQLGTYYAVDTEVVKLADTQTVTGAKTFTSTTIFDQSSGNGVRLAGTASGTSAIGSVQFYDNASTELARIGTAGSSRMRYQNFQNSYVDFGGASNATKMRLGTQVTLYAGDLADEAAQTQTLGGTGATSQLLVWNNAGSRNAGFNETPAMTVTGTVNINYTHIGSFLTRSGTGSAIISLNDNVTSIPIGGSFMVHNDNATGTMTIIEGTGTVDLQWIDGSGSTPLTGTRTLAYNGVATIRKKTSGGTDIYQIWGVGLS